MGIAYKRLDMSRIKFSGTLSMEEALKDVTLWNGTKKF